MNSSPSSCGLFSDWMPTGMLTLMMFPLLWSCLSGVLNGTSLPFFIVSFRSVFLPLVRPYWIRTFQKICPFMCLNSCQKPLHQLVEGFSRPPADSSAFWWIEILSTVVSLPRRSFDSSRLLWLSWSVFHARMGTLPSSELYAGVNNDCCLQKQLIWYAN